jgi:hypothetical protein
MTKRKGSATPPRRRSVTLPAAINVSLPDLAAQPGESAGIKRHWPRPLPEDVVDRFRFRDRAHLGAIIDRHLPTFADLPDADRNRWLLRLTEITIARYQFLKAKRAHQTRESDFRPGEDQPDPTVETLKAKDEEPTKPSRRRTRSRQGLTADLSDLADSLDVAISAVSELEKVWSRQQGLGGLLMLARGRHVNLAEFTEYLLAFRIAASAARQGIPRKPAPNQLEELVHALCTFWKAIGRKEVRRGLALDFCWEILEAVDPGATKWNRVDEHVRTFERPPKRRQNRR